MSADRSSRGGTDPSWSESKYPETLGGSTPAGSGVAGSPTAGSSTAGSSTAGSGTMVSSRFALQPESLKAPPEADPLDFAPLRSGDLMGPYRIDRVLGQGAMGIVYEASHRVVESRVAIKCLFPHAAQEPVKVQRLFREAKIAARVEHPNVVRVFDAGRDRDTYYLAMELLEGQTLGELLAKGQLPVDVIVSIFLQVMSGVAAVHAVGVVHRDLKPENIYMQTNPLEPLGLGVPKVLDFGVSKLYEREHTKKLTAVGVVMGTPFYMATEQVVNTSAVDQRADVYSLGVMLYEALTGALPYPGRSVIEIFAKAQDGRPTPMREIRSEIPPSLEALVAKALCPDKSGRFESVTRMREALEAVPLDGSDEWEDWSDVSQPWMLDKANAALHDLGSIRDAVDRSEKPLAPAVSSAPPPRPAPPGPPAQAAPLEPSPREVPTIIWLLAAAAAGTLVAAIGTAVLYFALA